MITLIKDSLKVIILSTVVLLSVYMVLAQVGWVEPTVAPPGGNVVAPLNTDSAGQSKSGGLILNTGGALNGLIVQSGNVGIGTTTPGSEFSVNGTIYSGSGGFKFPDGTTQATAVSEGSFGGIYSRGGGSCTNANPLTGACSCPAGYTDNTFASFTTNSSYGCGWYVGYTSTGPCGSYAIEMHQCWR